MGRAKTKIELLALELALLNPQDLDQLVEVLVNKHTKAADTLQQSINSQTVTEQVVTHIDQAIKKEQQ
jgi:hypothetical protein